MPYEIRQNDVGDYCVYKVDSDESFGCHPTVEDAEAQIAALYAEEAKQEEPEEEPEDAAVIADEIVQAVAEQVAAALPDALAEVLPGALEQVLSATEDEDEVSDDDDAEMAEEEDDDAEMAEDDDDDDAEMAEEEDDDAEMAEEEDDDEVEAEEEERPRAPVTRKGRVVAPASLWYDALSRALNIKPSKLETGVTVVKGKRGARYMLIVTSNSYRDRDGETITTKALKADVDRRWHDGAYFDRDPLLFWHDDRLRIGDIVFGDVRGPFLVEVAKEAATPVASVIWDYLEASPNGWGASHRFEFLSRDRTPNGVFKAIRKTETSILPREMAANPFTYSGVIGEKGMDKQRDEWLDKIFEQELGIEDASELLDKGIEHLTRKLAEAGYEHKARKFDETGALLEDLIEAHAALDRQVVQLKRKLRAALEREKQNLAVLSGLVEAVAALKANSDARPRSASRAAETELDEIEITEAAKRGKYASQPFWRGAR